MPTRASRLSGRRGPGEGEDPGRRRAAPAVAVGRRGVRRPVSMLITRRVGPPWRGDWARSTSRRSVAAQRQSQQEEVAPRPQARQVEAEGAARDRVERQDEGPPPVAAVIERVCVAVGVWSPGRSAARGAAPRGAFSATIDPGLNLPLAVSSAPTWRRSGGAPPPVPPRQQIPGQVDRRASRGDRVEAQISWQVDPRDRVVGSVLPGLEPGGAGGVRCRAPRAGCGVAGSPGSSGAGRASRRSPRARRRCRGSRPRARSSCPAGATSG